MKKIYAAAADRGRSTPLPGDAQTLLHGLGLRLTPQRITLASLLLKTAKRHVIAKTLYEETRNAQCSVSGAAISNALR